MLETHLKTTKSNLSLIFKNLLNYLSFIGDNMSAILLNAKNSKRFAKRLQKLLAQEFTQNLTLGSCQNYLAQIVGVEDWHRLNQLLESENIQSKTLTNPTPAALIQENEFSGRNPLISQLVANPAYHGYLEDDDKGATFLMEQLLNIAERLHTKYSQFNFNIFLLHHIEKGWVLSFNTIHDGGDYSFDKKDIFALYCLQDNHQVWHFTDETNPLNQRFQTDKIINYQINHLNEICFKSSLILTEIRIENFLQKTSKIHLPNMNTFTLLNLASIFSQNKEIVALSEKEIVIQNSERLFLVVTKEESDNQAIPYTVFESQWGHYHFNEDELSLGLHWHENPEQALSFIKNDIDKHNRKKGNKNLDNYMIMELLVSREEFLRSGNKYHNKNKKQKSSLRENNTWKTIFINHHQPALFEHIDSAYQNPEHSKKNKIKP